MKKFLITIIIITLFSCNSNKRTIILNIEDGTGLSENTNVVFKGKKIGMIKKIDIVGNNLIAKISISNDFKIDTSSEFYIVTTGFLGEKSIEIINSNNGEEYIYNIKDTIPCKVKHSGSNVLIKDFFDTMEAFIDTIQKSNNGSVPGKSRP